LYYCCYLNHYDFYFFADNFYNIFTQDKTFLETDIITLPNVRIKRLAESSVTNTTTLQKNISIQAIIDKNNGTKQKKQGKYLQINTFRIMYSNKKNNKLLYFSSHVGY